jgi:hypothetical protein
MIMEADIFDESLLGRYGLKEYGTPEPFGDDETVRFIGYASGVGDEYGNNGIAVYVGPNGHVMEWRRWNTEWARLIHDRYGYDVMDAQEFYDMLEARALAQAAQDEYEAEAHVLELIELFGEHASC